MISPPRWPPCTARGLGQAAATTPSAQTRPAWGASQTPRRWPTDRRRCKLRAAWYEHQGDPYHSLVVGEMPDPAPGAGEVRIVITVSGLSPGDVKKRSGW